MAASLLLPLLLLLLLAAAGGVVAVVVVVLLSVRGPAPVPSQAAAAAVRHGATVHAAALVLLLTALVAVPGVVAQVAVGPAQGVLLGLAPAAAGLVFAAVQALGEATWPRPTGRVRRAPLTRRTVGDVAPPVLRTAAWTWAGLAVVALVACGLAAAADGRSVGRQVAGGSTAAGPFPGWTYGVPLLAAVVVVLVAAEGVLRLVATRPTVADADPAWDLSLRRLSAHRVLRGAQLVLAWTTAGVLGVAGAALRNVGGVVTDAASASGVHLGLGTVALVLAAVAALGGLVLAVVPAPAAAPSGRLEPSGSAPAAA